MPTPGTFVLHSKAVPDLPAGPYTVRLTQTITAPGASAHTLERHLEVTAPRFTLPPDQVLSTFPPNQAEGAFGSRLPQIVLKRRTLPWERSGDVPGLPWLALVVLADAECEFRTARPVTECVTPGVVLSGTSDATTGNCVVVTETVVRKVFPAKDELPLLAHVRQVDLSDTELALGDDDGWLAVVLSNRLPQPGVRYRACLISLEGQHAVLPDSAEIEPNPADAFRTPFVYENAALSAGELSHRYGSRVDSARPGADGPAAVSSARSMTVTDAWSTRAATNRATRLTAPPTKTAHLVGAMHTVDMSIIDPPARQFTFPVLAHWQFTCTGAGDFQSLMQGLDVGMLGTLPAQPPSTGKPPPPSTRPAPEVLDTGHVALGHVSRAGEAGTIWYRGPLVPRPVAREQPDADGGLPLLHASDQARRIGPDGRENLSLAVAFEIGRLLALAEPSVVAALLNWRKEGFERFRRAVLIDREPLLGSLGKVTPRFGARAGLQVITGLGDQQAARLGPVRLPVDPGRPVEEIDDADLVELLATGFGLSRDLVKTLIMTGQAGDGGLTVPVTDQPTRLGALTEVAEREFAPLRDAALDTVTELARDALSDRAITVWQEGAGS
ncbi:hypothetical protein [Streptomyces sp. NPDC002088]|uniref:hypothetical protein n=1 Tax=Streptomyces sp. NPDC002088 TaxID=3154665 RepID=UPI0033282A5C